MSRRYLVRMVQWSRRRIADWTPDFAARLGYAVAREAARPGALFGKHRGLSVDMPGVANAGLGFRPAGVDGHCRPGGLPDPCAAPAALVVIQPP